MFELGDAHELACKDACGGGDVVQRGVKRLVWPSLLNCGMCILG